MKTLNAVRSWLDNVAFSHSGSENTQKGYERNLMRFCKFIGCTPRQILEDYENSNDRAFRRKYARYIKAWISGLLREGYTKSSIGTMTANVKSFFKYSDLPLGYVPVGKAHVVYHNRSITNEEIQGVIKVANRARDRAFFAVMAQSGLRPHTLCLLKIKHVELNREAPAKIDVPREIAKGKYRAYFTFIGPEALELLKSYLDTRANLTGESWLFSQAGVEKKLNRKTISSRFRDAVLKLKNSGKIEYRQKARGKPGSIRLYSLRKWFRKQAREAPDHVHFWMGHVLKNTDEHYFDKLDAEDHREIYKTKVMRLVSLKLPSIIKTDQKITELKETYEKKLAEQAEEIQKLKNSMEKIQPILQFAKEFDNQKAFHEFLRGIANYQKLIVETQSGEKEAWLRIGLPEDLYDKIIASGQKPGEYMLRAMRKQMEESSA